MKLYIDTANIKDIKEYNRIFKLDGVTTNPTIISKENQKDLNKILKPIVKELSKEQKLFVEVVSNKVKDIIKEAKYIITLKENAIPKIPVTKEGLEAIRLLSEEGIDVLATAIMSSTQAYLAIQNGAKYIAPYYNRMNNYSDSFEEISLMQELIDNGEYDCEIVGAGFKSTRQVKDLMLTGATSLTVTPEILKHMFMHEGTDNAVKTFEDNWAKVYKRKTLV